MTEHHRRQLVETARRMNALGLNRGAAGNLSVRAAEGLLITPSGMDYERMEPADIVALDGAGPSGTERGRPSSEWRIHRDVYRERPDAGAILHAHPVHCTALACLRRPLPAFHYMVAVAGGPDVRCAPYATFGTQELSDHVLHALEGRSACLMANHGLLCLAADLERALQVAVEIESLAQSYLLALAAGQPVLLDEEEMERVLRRFADYRQV